MNERNNPYGPTYVFDFPAQCLRHLVAHARAGEAHFLTMGERWSKFGVWDSFPDEEQQGTPALWLVKDAGVYLMSNTHPKRGGPVYAKGYGPTTFLPGDDYVERLELDAFDDIRPDERTVRIVVTETTIAIQRDSS